jgi:hypothetical protein
MVRVTCAIKLMAPLAGSIAPAPATAIDVRNSRREAPEIGVGEFVWPTLVADLPLAKMRSLIDSHPPFGISPIPAHHIIFRGVETMPLPTPRPTGQP